MIQIILMDKHSLNCSNNENNTLTGTIVITGHYDTNHNGEHDKTDKNEIGIYDLKTLELLSKI